MRGRVLAFAAVLALAGQPWSVARAAPGLDPAMAAAVHDALARTASAAGPGAVVLIARGDDVVYREALGRADLELPVPLATDQVFRIASVTKTFTAATVVKLAEDGRLSLDDPLPKYLPDIAGAEGVTLRHLLSHTSGVATQPHAAPPGFMRRDVDTATLLAEFRQKSPTFAPGSRYAYSNDGYVLLGAVIEKVTGRPWYEAVKATVVDPLGLKHTAYGAAAPIIPGRVAGYTTDPQTHAVRNAAYISASIPAAAGGLVSTADDLRLWMRALARGRIVTPASFQAMTAPPPAGLPGFNAAYGYGFGLFLWHVRGEPMVGHTGQIDGFASMVAYLPRQDVTVVVLANDDEFDAQTLGRRLAAAALGRPYGQVVPGRPSASDLAALAGSYRLDETTAWTFSVKDGRLFAQRGSRTPSPIQAGADGRLYFEPDELSYFAPVRDGAGAVVRLDFFARGEGPAQALPRLPQAPKS
ncbi:MAG: beta-lactamase family protein [Caulobacteraceae bacterium]|nr:beta-lactamase family protein [Caulobacteraceae bacterium]